MQQPMIKFAPNSAGMIFPLGRRNNKGGVAPGEFYDPPPENNASSAIELFCQNTSIHGLKYVGQPQRHVFERLFWLLAVSGAVTAAGLLLYKLLDSHINHNPVETVFSGKEMPIESIPFPAVTICNVNNIQASKWEGYKQRLKKLRDLERTLDQFYIPFNYTALREAFAAAVDVLNICHTKRTFVTRLLNQRSSNKEADSKLLESFLKEGAAQDRFKGYEQYHNPTRILREGSQSCKDMILFCSWRDELVDCERLFVQVETDFGSCCTFNTIPLSLLDTHFKESRDPKERVEEWQEADLTWDNLIFNTEESSSQNRKQPLRQKYPGMGGGLTVLLEPDLKEWFCSDIDSEGFVVGVNGPLDRPRMRDSGLLVQTDAEIFINVRPQITMSDESVKDINIGKRNCFFGSEKTLAHYSKYTASNCLDECIANRTLAECKCVQYYMPRRNTDELCKPSQYNCSDVIRKQIMEEGLAKACHGDCLPTCTEIKYRTEVTGLNIRKSFTNKIFEAYPELKSKSDNISILHVYFGVDSTYPRMRKQVYSNIHLISNTGGLLALCMGFSMLSLLEIVYHCTIRTICNAYQRKQKKLEKVIGAPSEAVESESSLDTTVALKQSRLMPTLFYRPPGDHLSTTEKDEMMFKIVHRHHSKNHQFPPPPSRITLY